MQDPLSLSWPLTRRDALRLGGAALGAAALAPGLASCGDDNGGGGGEGEVQFLSTQLAPIEEAEKFRGEILEGFEGSVRFVGDDNPATFADRVIAQERAGDVGISLLGGLHPHLEILAARNLLADLSDLGEELSGRGFNRDFLELARFGGDRLLFIPWMQATYIMAARREALEQLPGGADVGSLTYDQWREWGTSIASEEGSPRLGFPVADDGLIHRFFEGYAYPSYTGGLNTTFTSPGAMAMWDWMSGTWRQTNPQSTTYAFMQEPLLAGEVWVAWEHTARLINAFTTDPDSFVAFPAARGPEGLGYMPVVAGLAIPKGAPDERGARKLISYLTRPETAATTLRAVAFLPPFEQQEEVAADVDPGIRAEVAAAEAMYASGDAIPALSPVGLGEREEAYNQVFRTTFEQIVLDGRDAGSTLDEQAPRLQEVLDATKARCWRPDPESTGTCQVA
jgi:multiple sugar transport system substrate-binding protein